MWIIALAVHLFLVQGTKTRSCRRGWEFFDNTYTLSFKTINKLRVYIILVSICSDNYKQTLYQAVIFKFGVSDLYLLASELLLSITHNLMANDTKPFEIRGSDGKKIFNLYL